MPTYIQGQDQDNGNNNKQEVPNNKSDDLRIAGIQTVSKKGVEETNRFETNKEVNFYNLFFNWLRSELLTILPPLFNFACLLLIQVDDRQQEKQKNSKGLEE